jgi:hypothetical protein
MKTFWNWLTGRSRQQQQRNVVMRSLLLGDPVSNRVIKARLRVYFNSPGFQALVQVMEADAAYHQMAAIERDIIAAGPIVQAFHAGSAATLIDVLNRIEHALHSEEQEDE